ncbi:MAG: Nudix family hydrolase [Candidimonas sp.]|nr:MAG: Nudix family hydrolase [Candidimonas sp.]
MPKPRIEVAAGLIRKPDGRLLLAQRPGDKPWSGWWELPGGKIEPGETTLGALARELSEELGIQVTSATRWVTYTHDYPKNTVHLAFCRVSDWVGEPRGLEGQELRWVDPLAPLPVAPLLPATEPPLRWLRLPDRYLISSIGGRAGLPAFLDKLRQAFVRGVRLIQFREPGWEGAQAHDGLARVLEECHAHGARCLVNSCHPAAWRAQADGVHWRARDARLEAAKCTAPRDAARPGFLTAVSAHGADDLAAARALGADFIVLGHVLATTSHPGSPGMGWTRFAQLCENAELPVFAIGGQSPATMATATHHGAHGIAGIRCLAS